MTLDNVIKSFEKCAKYTWNGKPTVAAEECKQMAEWLKDYKRLLEQQDDAIKYFDTIYKVSQTCGMPYSFVENKVKKAATALKTLQQEPSSSGKQKMGWWIDDKCSVCGKGIEDLIDSPEWYQNEIPKYCPFCGIKLVDSQESEVEE